MEINLNRKQLQETLREMGIRFPPDASRDELKEILEEANRRQWLKTACTQTPGRLGQVIRRRGRASHPPAGKSVEPPAPAASRKAPAATALPRVPAASQDAPLPALGRRPKPREQVSAPVFDRTANLETYALARANGVCDLCEQAPAPAPGGKPTGLRPCFFADPPDGGPRTVKTVAALCPDCYERVSTSPSVSDLKLLKRKARRPRQAEVAVSNRSDVSRPPGGKTTGRKRPAEGRRPRRRTDG